MKSILEEFLLELNVDGNANNNGEDQNDDIDAADSGNDTEDTGGDQPNDGQEVDDIDAADSDEEPDDAGEDNPENAPQNDVGEEPPAEADGDDIDAADSGEEPDDGGDDNAQEDDTADSGGEDDANTGGDDIDAADGSDDIDSADNGGSGNADSGGDGESGNETEGTDSGSGSGNDGSGASGSGLSDEEKNAENDIYESLSDEDKMIRNIQLKSKFAQLHEDADNYMESINRITKNDENILPLKKIVVALGKVKTYIVDYLENIYNSTSYIDNFTNYVKFLVVFRTIGNVLKEMSKKDK